MSTLPHLIDAATVVERCSPVAAVNAIERAVHNGLDPAGDMQRLSVPVTAGHLLLMPSGAHDTYTTPGIDKVGIKVAAVAPANPAAGLPRIQAVYLLLDAATLALQAVIDGTALTTLRTPAVSVAAIKAHLLRSTGPLDVAVIGHGPQATGHATTLDAVIGPHRACNFRFLVRDTDRANRALPAGSSTIQLDTAHAADTLRGADVVVCATSSRQPLFDGDVIADHAVVVAVGSHEPDAREVDAALCRRATVTVEDSATALREAGDIVLAVAEHAIAPHELVALKDLVAGTTPTPLDRPLLFKSVGMSWEDLVIADALVRDQGV